MVEEELSFDPHGLDLRKAFNCFNQIPSAGARYSIKLCVDVPDNKNPMYMPPQTGSETGHSFLIVTKSNRGASIIQVFGLYAQFHPGYFNPWRPIPSTIKNNQLREINASIEMSITSEQFQLLREKAFEYAKAKYSAANYNCTSFGINVFNSLRTAPITTESYSVYIPHNNHNIYGTSNPERIAIVNTPQKLFKKLKEMKFGKGKDSDNIVIDTTGNTKAPISHGECNY
jgi:hypothetical protein